MEVKNTELKMILLQNDAKTVMENIKGIEKNNFKDRISFTECYNMAVFKVFSDYFNIINQQKEKQERDGVKIIGLVNSTFRDTIELHGSFGEKQVFFKFLDLTIKMNFHIYKQNGEVYYEVSISSVEKTEYKASFIYEEIFGKALKESELLGSYITMPSGVFKWDIKNLEKRTMDDIYLPKKQIEDLKMFIDVYSNNDELLRYLFVGVPGAGKTESCLVLMNELNDKKVTIIKTSVCPYIAEKVKLATLLKPCIIIFDDLDLSLGSRNSGGYSNLLQNFLDILDGTDKLPKDVGILATTNSAALLDLAAQRPGRFDKVMIFDELTKNNVEKIIIKSLKYNFQIEKEEDIKVFIDDKIINKFYDSKVTGAHIYNSISMMKLKYDMITKNNKNKFDISVDWLLSEIESEIKTLDKIKNQQTINDRLGNSSGNKKIGFGHDRTIEDDLESIGRPYYDECAVEEG